jgi:FkbM family methyltransferase
LWSRAQEWRSRRGYDSNSLRLLARSSGPAPEFDQQDTSVTPPQARELLAALLATEAMTGPIVEVGSYRGVTTHLLATHTRRPIVAVDPFAGYGGAEEELMRFNQRIAGLQNVTHLRLTSGEAAHKPLVANCSFVFIDAVHDYVNTRFDGMTWAGRLCPGGMLAFHDTDQKTFAGTRRFVTEWSRHPDFELYSHVDNLTIFRKRSQRPPVNSKVELTSSLLIDGYRTILRLTRKRGLFTLARLNAKIFSSGQIIAVPAGARLFVPSDPHFFGFVLGTHESHVAEIFIHYLRPGDACIDVGANIGYFSAVMAALVGTNGQVTAFEPVPENFAVLERNAALTAEEGLHLHSRHEAVSAQRGELKIMRKEWSTYHEVAPIVDGESSIERIPAVPLDDIILPGMKPIGMLKIDVEGHELSVVEGMKKSLEARRVRYMVIEVTPGEDASRIEQLIRPHARCIRAWNKSEWIDQSLARLSARTDVFVEFSV